MPRQTFILNGKTVTVDVADDVRLLWVLRDLLGVTGPKYGCGINVCKACTSHINGKAFNPCAVPVGRPAARRRDHHHRGPARAGASAARRRTACTRCRRPGWTATSRSAATASPARSWPRWRWSGRYAARAARSPRPTSTRIRNICRCGTYTRIREAIVDGAARM